MKRQSYPELLSPAGSLESLYAAVNNGCNAVYFGGKGFNARNFANNFTIDEIRSAVDYCHLRDVKVFMTVNTLVKNNELSALNEYINEIYRCEIDGVIVQDFGVAEFIKKYYPNLPLHASTQMTIHNIKGVELLRDLGFSRVVLSRELDLKQIKDIVDKSNTEIECFVHGALCYSYSGQCLLSSFIGGRSGNRGRCAQPCRLPYRLYNSTTKLSGKDNYILSLKDVQTLTILPQLIDAGIHSFKIEGRMKRPEYVAGVTSIYRYYIDKYKDNPNNYSVNNKDINILKQLFNRGGFSNGYYINKKDMIYAESPKNEGLLIGKVVNYNRNICTIQLKSPLNKGDGIEIRTNQQPHPGTRIKNNCNAQEKLVLNINGKINMGDLVYKTKDITLLDKLNKDSKIDSYKRGIKAEIVLQKDQKAYLKLYDDKIDAIVYGKIVEASVNNPTSKERVIKQINKLGNTIFDITEVIDSIEDDIFIPISEINFLRRQAVSILEDKIRKTYHKDKYKMPELEQKKVTKYTGKKQLSVLIPNIKYLDTVLKYNIDIIYLDIETITVSALEKAISKSKQNNIKLYIAMPSIFESTSLNKYDEILKHIEDSEVDGFLIRTYGQYNILKDSEKELILDYNFNVTNNLTVENWKKLNVKLLTLSLELNSNEISGFNNGESLEMVVYGYIPVMLTKQCVYNNITSNCKNKSLKSVDLFLMDRINKKLLVETHCKDCYNKLYNPEPIFLGNDLKIIKSLPLKSYRLQFVNESLDEVAQVLDCYTMLKENKTNISNYDVSNIINHFKNKGYTKGHIFRGID